MEQQDKKIHEIDMSLIANLFKASGRQGPGSEEVTKLALAHVRHLYDLPENALIADLGCGTGGQTITLAKNVEGHIHAMDMMPEFTAILRERAEAEGVGDRITVHTGSMGELPFEEGQFDMIWAEGSIYNIGYSNGLRYLHKFLKPGGIVAVTEATWFTPNPRPEIYKFWHDNYPEIDTTQVKLHQMADAGYAPMVHFALPEQSWWNYLDPIRAYIPEFLEKQGHSPAAVELAGYFEKEVGLYDKYHADYGYVFYIGRKI